MISLPKFHNPALLTEALTHSSYVNECLNGKDNKRLEFLGDSVLKYVLTMFVFEHPSQLPRGYMTTWRSHHEKNETLARWADRMQLGNYLRMSENTERQGGRTSPNILSSALEALIGAYHEDSGLEAVKLFIGQLLLCMEP